MSKKYSNIIFVLLFAVFLTVGAFFNPNDYEYQKNSDKLISFLRGERDIYPIKKRYQSNVSSNSSASLVSLVNNEKRKNLFELNSDSSFPMASITKLMTAIVVIDNYKLEEKIVIDEKSINTEGDPKKLVENDVYTVKNLLYIMLVESNNEAAEVFANKIGRERFIRMMNKKAEIFKMKNTKYLNPTGLDIEDNEETNTTSPNDIGTLVMHIINNYPLIANILSKSEYSIFNENGNLRTSNNTNVLLAEDSDFIWGKTGFTEKAKGCLVIISRPPNFSFFEKNYIISIIMGAEDRFGEAKNFKAWTYNQFIW
ncbi:serine hydrolase [bacterium]|nr:serine hydrolase [bacterium]